MISTWAAYTAMRRSSHSLSGASLQGGTSSSLGLMSQPGSTISMPFISSCLAVRRASHPLRYLPMWRAMASSGACSGQWGAVYATYWKNGLPSAALSSIILTALSEIASVM